MYRIEPAALEHLPQLADLLEELFSMEPDFQPDREKQLGGLRQIIEDPRIGWILTAREGKSVIAMVNLLFTISTAQGGRVVLMEDLIVRASHRGKGVGSQLLKQVIEFAGDRGASRITVLTGGDNAGAKRFYQKHGFQASRMLPLRLHLNAG
jgi:GNAT superfamily N-acetyltransferase